jgi:hypothetical protein
MTDVKKKRVKAEKPQWVGYLTEKQKEKLHDSIDPDASLGQQIAIIQKIHRMVLRNHKNDPAYETLYGAVITATNLFLDSAFYTPTLQATLPYWFSVAYFDYLYHVGVLTDADLILHTLQMQGGNDSSDPSSHDA